MTTRTLLIASLAVALGVGTGCTRFVEILVEDKGYGAGSTFAPTPELSRTAPELSRSVFLASRELRIEDDPIAQPVRSVEPEDTLESGVPGAPARPDAIAAGRAAASGAAAAALAVLDNVYFEFDSWRLDDAATQTLERHADWLREHPTQRLIIEGHCDQRGTTAYNMVLGEKRARAVRNYLVNLEIPARRLATVSYGKERPVCDRPDEDCYRENRRGHLVLKAMISRVP